MRLKYANLRYLAEVSRFMTIQSCFVISNIQVDGVTIILLLSSAVRFVTTRSLSFTRALYLERNLTKIPVRPFV